MTERDIFLAVIDLPDLAARAAYLDGACAGDAARRARVEALLRSHEAAGSFLIEPAVDPGQAATGTIASDAGDPTATGGVAAADDPLAFLDPPKRPDALGRVGHYEVLQRLGQGGFGTVVRAFDEKLHRVVAIKVLSPAFAANGAARKRFIREARAAAAVKNEHVVGIYDVQEDAQPPYLVMECIDGISLQDKLDMYGALGVKEILRIGIQTAEGLAAAHKQGLVHRDIKPANILLENGVERVKITDFGLARAVDDASVTQSGTVAGTPMYMSPEQAEGLAVDHRSDLFSLGTVLYAMCTGHPPFRAGGTHAVLKRVIEDQPRGIPETNSDIPEWLCDIVARLHAKKPEERFQTAKEVADLLGQHLAELQQPASAARIAQTAGTRPPLPTEAGHAEALGRLKAPAIGLTVTGILYWLTIPVFVIMAFSRPVDLPYAKLPQLDDNLFNYLWVRMAIMPAVAGLILIFGGRKMRHAELYWLCVLAALLPFALLVEKLVTLREHRFTMTLGDWTALPFGMWSLLVLTRRDVRAAFAPPNDSTHREAKRRSGHRPVTPQQRPAGEPPAVPPRTWRTGERVLAPWEPEWLYAATVREVNGARLLVSFDDGDADWVDAKDVRPLDVPNDSRVEGWWYGYYYPATVIERDGTRVRLEYDDGDSEWTELRCVRVPAGAVVPPPGRAPSRDAAEPSLWWRLVIVLAIAPAFAGPGFALVSFVGSALELDGASCELLYAAILAASAAFVLWRYQCVRFTHSWTPWSVPLAGVLAVGAAVVALDAVGGLPGKSQKVVVLVEEPPPPVAKSDHDRIQGTWKAVAGDIQGQPVPDVVLKAVGPTVTFAGDKVTWKVHPAPEVKDPVGAMLARFSLDGVFHLDPAKSPRTIDLTVLGQNAKTPLGTPAPRALLGIYRLDGDSLEICIAIDPDRADERPGKFESIPGKAIGHFKLRREPAATPDPAAIQALRDQIAAKARALETVQIRVTAGLLSAADEVPAKIELAEARIHLAQVERDPALVRLLEDLVRHREEERRFTAVIVDVGRAPPDAIDRVDAALAAAKARLAQARTAQERR